MDSGGEFHVYPLSDPRCALGYQLNQYTCGIKDDAAAGNGLFRHNFNQYDGIGRDLRSALARRNLFI